MSMLDKVMVEDFKEHFYRDFAYSQSDPSQIMDQDITKAFNEANMMFNPDLWDDLTSQKLAFLYLSAFYLVMDIKNSSAGLNSSFSGFTSSKSVDTVSESFWVPQWMQVNPIYSTYMSNGYGQKYLTLIYPRLIGNVFVVDGAVTW